MNVDKVIAVDRLVKGRFQVKILFIFTIYWLTMSLCLGQLWVHPVVQEVLRCQLWWTRVRRTCHERRRTGKTIDQSNHSNFMSWPITLSTLFFLTNHIDYSINYIWSFLMYLTNHNVYTNLTDQSHCLHHSNLTNHIVYIIVIWPITLSTSF